MTKKILILGSRPDAKIVQHDFVYAANAASYYYSDQLTDKKKLIDVVSGDILVRPMLEKYKSEKDFYLEKLHRIASSHSEAMALAPGQPRAVHLLRESGYKNPIIPLNHSRRRNIIGLVSGLTDPIVSDHFLSLEKEQRDILLNSMLKVNVRRVKNANAEHNNYFRPSTGVFALCFAIYRHGRNATYTIAGMGLSSRATYPDMARNLDVERDNTHVFADKKVLEVLASTNYRINTTDPMLKSILPLVERS